MKENTITIPGSTAAPVNVQGTGNKLTFKFDGTNFSINENVADASTTQEQHSYTTAEATNVNATITQINAAANNAINQINTAASNAVNQINAIIKTINDNFHPPVTPTAK